MTGLYPEFEELIAYWRKVGAGGVPNRADLRLVDLMDISAGLTLMDVSEPGKAIYGFVGADVAERLGAEDSGSDIVALIDPVIGNRIVLLSAALHAASCGAHVTITTGHPDPGTLVDLLMLPLGGHSPHQKFILNFIRLREPNDRFTDSISLFNEIEHHTTRPLDLGFGAPATLAGGDSDPG